MKNVNEKDLEEVLNRLSGGQKVKPQVKLFKLLGVKTRSVKYVQTVLIKFFKLKEVGGLHFLESAGCWVFFADPTSVREVGKLPGSTCGIQIKSWNPMEVDQNQVGLIILANDTKNKKELKSVRKASKAILEAFKNKDPNGIEEVSVYGTGLGLLVGVRKDNDLRSKIVSKI